MKRITLSMGQNPIVGDPVAKGMWGRVKSQTFQDKRKKDPKHKGRYW